MTIYSHLWNLISPEDLFNKRLRKCFQLLSWKLPKSSRNYREFERNKMAGVAPLQPPTLAAFLPWGSSEGAGRADRAQS